MASIKVSLDCMKFINISVSQCIVRHECTHTYAM